MKKNKNKDVLIIAFAVFSMFFGAGNLIFPPFIGLTSGHKWIVSFLGFILSDVGLILLSIGAIARAGSFKSILKKSGNNLVLL